MSRALTYALPDAAPAPRPPSDELTRALAVVLQARPAGSEPRLTRDAALRLRPEAEARLAALTAALGATAAPETIAQWVMRIIALVGQPRDADEIEARRAALVDALATVPRRCITRASAEKVARLCGGSFPPLARILEIIGPEAEDLRVESRRLQAVIAASREAPPVRTPEETAAMRAKAQAVAAELRARARQAEEEDRAAAAAVRAAERRATDPETPEEELRAMAASPMPGAALARMRLATVERRRAGRGGDA